MKARVAIEGILSWVNATSLTELEHLASNDMPVRDIILQRYPLKYKPIADIMIGKKGREELRDMTDNDFSIVIDEALRRFPAKGLILWKHKEWSLRNIQETVNEYLSL